MGGGEVPAHTAATAFYPAVEVRAAVGPVAGPELAKASAASSAGRADLTPHAGVHHGNEHLNCMEELSCGRYLPQSALLVLFFTREGGLGRVFGGHPGSH